MSKITEAMVEAAKSAYWHEVHNGGGYSDKCYEAAISAALSAGQAQPVAWLSEKYEGKRLDDTHVTFIRSVMESNKSRGYEITPLYASPPAVPGEVERPSYQQIIDLVQDCVRRMHDAGESHRMMSRWISEGIDKLFVPAKSKWQPIATARKDGTAILAFDNGWLEPEITRWSESESAWCNGSWCWNSEPAYWQPLPAAPSDLIERLRTAAFVRFHDGWESYTLAADAATRIETLEREVEELRGEIERMRSDRLYIIGFNAGWESAHEQQPGDDSPFAAAKPSEAEGRESE